MLRTKPTQAVIYVGYALVLAGLFVTCAELVLRARGFKPWNANDVRVSSIHVKPGGRFFEKHPTFGYSHIPGRFDVTLGDGGDGEDRWRFTVTHLPSTLRITRQVDSAPAFEREDDIWIFGCSITHGWSVNDEETYPWLLQERFPQYNVVNFGVSGYGTVHSLLQFRDALKNKTPKVAVLAYADFHDERNTFARTRRKSIAPWNRLGALVQPYARLDGAGGLQYFIADVEYPEFPLMRRLALSHFIETSYNRVEPRWLHSHAVSAALVLEMARLAKQHQVKFLVANISGTARLNLPEEESVPIVDISLDLARPENTNLPYDFHPSAFAHAQYAQKLEPVIAAALVSKH